MSKGASMVGGLMCVRGSWLAS